MSLRRGKSFLDTNIFIYTFDTSARSKRATARTLIAHALQNRLAVISYQVVQEFLECRHAKIQPSYVAF